MNFGKWLGSRVRGRRDAPGQGEADAPADTGTARSRATGGVSAEDAGNPNSTTGTTPSETFVGRASGDDALDAGETGAERRAEYQQEQRAGDDERPT